MKENQIHGKIGKSAGYDGYLRFCFGGAQALPFFVEKFEALLDK